MKVYNLNQRLMNLQQIRQRLVEKLQREKRVLAFREYAAYMNEAAISERELAAKLRPLPDPGSSSGQDSSSHGDIDDEEEENEPMVDVAEKSEKKEEEESKKKSSPAKLAKSPPKKEERKLSVEEALEQYKAKIKIDVRLYTKVLTVYDFVYQYNTLLGIPLYSFQMVRSLDA